MFETILACACGYLLKDAKQEELVEVI